MTEINRKSVTSWLNKSHTFQIVGILKEGTTNMLIKHQPHQMMVQWYPWLTAHPPPSEYWNDE